MMKHTKITWVAGILLGGLVATVSGQTVYSNMVGFQKVLVENGKQAMASTPFDNTDNTLANVFSGQLAPGPINTAADNVLKWDATAGAYRIFWELNAGPLAGQWVEAGVGVADNEPINPGEGFWVTNSQTPGMNTVVFVGEVPTDPSIGIVIDPGLQMVHNPYPAEFSIRDTALSDLNSKVSGGTNISTSDLVFQWSQVHNAYDRFWYLSNLSKWVKVPADPNATSGFVGENGVPDFVLEPGAAVWYQRRANAGSFTWNITRPYNVP